MKFLVTGDTHGRVLDRLSQLDETKYPKDDTAIIILGDAGLNYYLNKTDERNKRQVNDFGYLVYCVRGNHEERPTKLPTVDMMFDFNVGAPILLERAYPNIRYLMDGMIYYINGYIRTLVIGGAYSVDKYYRLANAPLNAKWTGWFEDEQLSEQEMRAVEAVAGFENRPFDFVLSHTCPFSWMPTDLFLSGLDQSTVDNTMEKWMEEFKDKFEWKIWLFGHFHDDRLVRPGVEMYYRDIEELDTIYQRWTQDEQPDWWLRKDPKYFQGR